LNEVAQAELDLALMVNRVNLDWEKIKAIRGALRRIESGDYGTCDACGEPIRCKRLEAIPSALLCASCQSDCEAARDSLVTNSRAA